MGRGGAGEGQGRGRICMCSILIYIFFHSLHKIPNIFHSLEFLLLMLESDLIEDVPYEQQTGEVLFQQLLSFGC